MKSVQLDRLAVLLVVVTLACSLVSVCQAQDERQNPQPVKPKQQKLSNQKQAPQGNITTCGSLDDLVNRVEVCAAPLMDILQGTIAKWPRNDPDIADMCQSFFGCERCIRDNSRKCAKGLQKTIISTLANSVQRARKRECSPQKFPALLKTLQCIERNQNAIHEMVSNATSHLLIVENQIKDVDKRTVAVCCMVHDIERAIKATLNPICPQETKIIIQLYRAVLEDVTALICRAPSCKDVFKGYQVKPTKDFGGIIAILLRIIFSLG